MHIIMDEFQFGFDLQSKDEANFEASRKIYNELK